MNEESVALLEMAAESIAAARLIVEENHSARIAVSCAYYAMFYVAKALLIHKGLDYSKHSAVISAFGQYLAKTGEVPVDYHRHLIAAEKDRITADYATHTSFSIEDAMIHINHAQQFLELGRVFLSASPGDPTA